MFKTIPIPILNDNYVWVIIYDNKTVVIDPGSASEVINFHQKNNLTITNILITHRHNDHIDGVQELMGKYSPVVYAPYHQSFNFKYTVVKDKDVVSLFNDQLSFEVMHVPGHTLEHVVYHGSKMLFCGDTLFSFGCGRVFEGTLEQMHKSLKKISKIDCLSKVYCTHEYTKNNLRFLSSYFKNDKLYQSNLKKLENIAITVPSLLKDELEFNPFLNSNLDDFKAIRKAKDLF